MSYFVSRDHGPCLHLKDFLSLCHQDFTQQIVLLWPVVSLKLLCSPSVVHPIGTIWTFMQ